MIEILFLFLAFITIFLSVKISYYADVFSRSYGISKVLVGGILLAGVTSLPEFVTCFSAIIINNPSLALGDIFGSNIFNIFMICFFDLLFIKKYIFNNINLSHQLVSFILIINYIFIIIFINKLSDFSFFSIGIPTAVIIITYIFYLMKIPKNEQIIIKDSNNIHIVVKLIITSLLMVVSSTLLTIIVNELAIMHPKFSSSFLGAILLGVTTSLPEVVTFYTLISINSYDLAVSNILGSNLFNFLVLSLGDFLFYHESIYKYGDKDSNMLVILGLIFSLVCYGRIRIKQDKLYFILPLFVVVLYFSFWFLKML